MPGPHRRRRPPLLATATSSCSARSPTLTAAGIGIEGVRRILELEHQVAALRARNDELVAELPPPATRCARGDPRRTDANKLPVLRQPDPPPPSSSGAATAALTGAVSPAGRARVGRDRARRRRRRVSEMLTATK